jgi:hypothetical protein
MPYCPSCGYEYRRGATSCRECGEDLLAGEPRCCDNCDGEIDADSDCCPHCGIVFEREEGEIRIKCEAHPRTAAVGVCIICATPVCRDCAVCKKGKVFCNKAEHAKIHQNWAVLCSTVAEYEAEMVKANLELAGIKTMVFSQVDHAYFAPLSRLAVVKVMVPKEKLTKAKEVLRQSASVDEEGESENDLE